MRLYLRCRTKTMSGDDIARHIELVGAASTTRLAGARGSRCRSAFALPRIPSCSRNFPAAWNFRCAVSLTAAPRQHVIFVINIDTVIDCGSRTVPGPPTRRLSAVSTNSAQAARFTDHRVSSLGVEGDG